MTRARNKDELLEAIVAQFTQNLRQGRRPSIAAYQKKYPDFHDEIEELLSSVAMIEELKHSPPSQGTRRIRQHMQQLNGLERIGDYDIVRELGRGGMGVVFQAVHRSLGRRVAVKVIPAAALDNESYIARFRREARAAAKLHHTNIVSVFGVGQDQGLHYYVMEFVDGQNLADVLAGLRTSPDGDTSTSIADPTHAQNETRMDVLSSRDADIRSEIKTGKILPTSNGETQAPFRDGPPESEFEICVETGGTGKRNGEHTSFQPKHRFRWAAKVGAQIADALSYAHGQGVLHRDVKPSNMMLDGEGRVWITDFGLVKDATHQALTQTGEIVGTPQYMAPEAFEGNYDHRSETYCLGLTLYELVTLEPAFDQATTQGLIRSILTTSPAPPRKKNPAIPADLDTIICKAIEREPGRRYQTAREFRDDLRAFLDDRPISARKPGSLEQAVRWSRRNPLSAALAGLSVVLLFVATVASTAGYLATNRALRESRQFASDLKDKQGELEKAYLTAERERKAAVESAKVAREQSSRAQQEFDRAEANVQLMLQALDKTFSYVVSPGESRPGLKIDAFHDLAGLEQVISDEDAAFLSEMLDYYERFAARNENDETLMLESAKAYRRVANICQLIGDSEQSLSAFRKAVRIYRDQLSRHPDSITLAAKLVRTNNEFALACRRSRLTKEMRRAIQESEETLSNHPHRNSAELRLEYARTLNLWGGITAISTVSGTSNPARIRFSRGMGMWNRDSLPNEVARRRNQLVQPMKVNNSEAIEIIEQLLGSDPDNTELKIERAKSYCFRAAFLFAEERDKSMGLLMQGIDQFEELKREHPNNADVTYSLAMAYAMPPVDAMDKGRIWLARAARLIDELADNNPGFLEYRFLQVMITCKSVDQMIVDQRYQDAERLLDKTVDEVREYAQAAGRTQAYPRMNLMLAGMYELLAGELRQQDRRRDAWSVSAKAKKLRPTRPANREQPVRNSRGN